jgi:hypothetical protein
MKPRKGEVFARNSSLAIEIIKDDKYGLEFYVWNRRTNSIVGHYKIPLLTHCRDSWQDIEPIKEKRNESQTK